MSNSAPNINNVTLVGQLTADPELRSLPSAMKQTPARSTSQRAARWV
jgi:single-stranded DNA-binding protein